jgi:hypothetical protein
MNEYRTPELNVQNGVLKSLSFLFEYIQEMGKDYVYAVTPLLEDALMDRDLVHRQTAAAAVKHLVDPARLLSAAHVLMMQLHSSGQHRVPGAQLKRRRSVAGTRGCRSGMRGCADASAELRVAQYLRDESARHQRRDGSHRGLPGRAGVLPHPAVLPAGALPPGAQGMLARLSQPSRRSSMAGLAPTCYAMRHSP